MMNLIVSRYLAGEAINRLVKEYGIPYGTLRQRLLKVSPPIRRRGQHEAESSIARFLKYTIPEPNSGCWLWLAGADKFGYGRFWLDGRKQTAQRAAWILFCGDIPNGFEIDHICKTPSCVNPEHLQAVTKMQNLSTRDSTRQKCLKGHPLDDGNILYENGGLVRRCKLCRANSRSSRKGSQAS